MFFEPSLVLQNHKTGDFLIILQLHKHSFSGKEAALLEAEIGLEAVHLFPRKVGDDLIAAGTEPFAGDEEKEGAELRVGGLTPGISSSVRPADEDGALLLAFSKETLPAVIRTRKSSISRALLLFSSVEMIVCVGC